MSSDVEPSLPDPDAVAEFVRTAYRSVWAIELLCHLQDRPGEYFTPEWLVAEMRSSEQVVRQSVAALVAVGLVSVDAGGSVRYSPASQRLDGLAKESRALYQKNPDAVRRLIVSGASPGLAAFADAFKLR